MFKIVNKTRKRVKYILDNLRPEDAEECQLIFGENWKQIELKEIMNIGCNTRIALYNNKPIAMGGLTATDKTQPDIAMGWLLCTNDIDNCKISIMKNLVKELKKADNKFWLIYNYVSDNNKLAHKWLKGLDFKIGNIKGVPVKQGFQFFYRFRPMKGLS